MAKQVLPTNFVDDILAPSMGRKRKYRIIDNGDDTYSLEDVTEYTQTGSDFGAGQINATNKAVNESCDKANVIDSLNDIVANQADGMIAGAKAVAELNNNLFFKPGDKISLTSLAPVGYITNNASRMVVDIPVGKRLDKIANAKTNLVSGIVRQNGNYLVGSIDDSHGFDQTQGSFLVLKDTGILRWQYDFSGTITNAINNDTISVHFTGGEILLS